MSRDSTVQTGVALRVGVQKGQHLGILREQRYLSVSPKLFPTDGLPHSPGSRDRDPIVQPLPLFLTWFRQKPRRLSNLGTFLRIAGGISWLGLRGVRLGLLVHFDFGLQDQRHWLPHEPSCKCWCRPQLAGFRCGSQCRWFPHEFRKAFLCRQQFAEFRSSVFQNGGHPSPHPLNLRT